MVVEKANAFMLGMLVGLMLCDVIYFVTYFL